MSGGRLAEVSASRQAVHGAMHATMGASKGCLGVPVRVARGRLATVAVNQFTFKQPVSIGDLLSFYARITRIGRTSITVHVEVYAERDPVNPHVVKVTEANLTYVAIDAQGQPREIPREA